MVDGIVQIEETETKIGLSKGIDELNCQTERQIQKLMF